MGHFDTTRKTRLDRTPREWLSVGSQIAEIANDWAGRSDLVTFVGEKAGGGAAACYVPRLAEIEVDVDIAFHGAPPSIIPDLRERKNLFEYPAASGAILHEAFHARYSGIGILEDIHAEKDRNVAILAEMMEESRIEALGLKMYPKNKAFLRSCALDIVLKDFKEDADFADGGVISFSRLMLLTLARVDAGSLQAKDVKTIQEYANKFFEKSTLKSFRKIWKKIQSSTNNSSAHVHLECAREWIALLEEEGHDPSSETAGEDIPEWMKDLLESLGGSGGSGEDSGEGEGESSSGDSKGSGEDSDEESVLEAMAEAAAESAAVEANGDYVQEVRDAIAKKKQEQAKERSTHAKESGNVYGRGTGPAGTSSYSSLIRSRPPKATERAAAVKLGKALEKAQYRDRVQTQRTSLIPPGRLNSRRAVAAAEQRSRNVNVTSEAWSRKMRKHTDDPTLTVGMLVDISGSMSSAMEPMASCAWIMSEAVRRVQGKVSSMYYGNDVFPVLKSGQHLDEVKVYDAADGTERFDQAFKALDGHLNLLNSSGARLLVIVSDFHYTGHEMERTQHWIKRCHDSGVGVIVIPFGYDATAKGVIDGLGRKIELIDHTKTGTGITAAAHHIGEAAIRQLNGASQ